MFLHIRWLTSTSFFSWWLNTSNLWAWQNSGGAVNSFGIPRSDYRTGLWGAVFFEKLWTNVQVVTGFPEDSSVIGSSDKWHICDGVDIGDKKKGDQLMSESLAKSCLLTMNGTDMCVRRKNFKIGTVIHNCILCINIQYILHKTLEK